MEYEELNEKTDTDPRLYAIPDIHGHAKGEHKAFIDERPIPLSARMLFLWFYHACRRGWPRFLMVSDHMNYLTFEDPAAINLVRRALKLAQAGDLYGAAETASVEVGQAAIVSEGLRRGMRYSIGAEVDNDPRSRPDAQNIVDAMKPDGMIRSVHFLTIDHPTHGPNWNWPFDNPEFSDVYDVVGTAKTWELYMATLLDAIERLPGNILGHFYVPALFGHWPDDATLADYETKVVEACEARGMAIEFNTRFLYRDHSADERARYLAAHRRLLSKCKERNVGIAIGSDAHSPKDQGGAFDAVLALLDECEINELVFPIAGRLARVALRVERKTEAVGEPASGYDKKLARRVRPSVAPAATESASASTPAPAPAPAPEPQTSEPAPVAKAKSRPKRSRSAAEVTDQATPISASAHNPESAEAGATSPELGPPVIVATIDSVFTNEIAPVVTEVEFEPIVVEVPAPIEGESTELIDVEAPEPIDVEAPELSTVDIMQPIGLEAAEPIDEAAEAIDEATEPIEEVPESVGVESHEPIVGGIAKPVVKPETNGAAPDLVSPTPRKSRASAPKGKPAAARTKPPATAANAAVKKVSKPGVKAVATAKKAAAKKAPVKRASSKKDVLKRAPAKKLPAKKAAVRATAAKKTAVKKTAAKKANSKKPAQRRR